MISKINERPVVGALCINCKNELQSMVVDTNHGKQTFYVCENENCGKRRNLLTTEYFPPAETEAKKNA